MVCEIPPEDLTRGLYNAWVSKWQLQGYPYYCSFLNRLVECGLITKEQAISEVNRIGFECEITTPPEQPPTTPIAPTNIPGIVLLFGAAIVIAFFALKR